MRLFGAGGEPDVPDTIGEQRMNEIKAAGRRAYQDGPWFSKEAVRRRVAGNEQREKRHLS